MQGKLFQRCTHLLYCCVLSLGGNVNTRRVSQPDMGSIFHIKNPWNILVIGNYYVNYQNLMLLPPRILNEHWCIYSCLQIPLRENWFQCVSRVYTTAFNFPCITPLIPGKFYGCPKLQKVASKILDFSKILKNHENQIVNLQKMLFLFYRWENLK